MTDDSPQKQLDIWERWDWLWHTTFYVAILISFAFSFQSEFRSLPVPTIGLLTLMLTIWHWTGMTLAYRNLVSWETYPGIRLVILVGDILLWFMLAIGSPTYYVALFGLFIQIFRHLPIRFATITALLLTSLMIVEQVVDSGEILYLA